MRCPHCNQRWAPFPEEDFTIIPGNKPGCGIIAKTREATARREKVFESEEIKLDPECEQAECARELASAAVDNDFMKFGGWA